MTEPTWRMSMSNERRYNEYILGYAKSLETITKEELFSVKKKEGDTLHLWRRGFIETLLHHKLQVDEFIELYQRFKKGDKQPILDLGILPDRLLKCRRLAVIYISMR